MGENGFFDVVYECVLVSKCVPAAKMAYFVVGSPHHEVVGVGDGEWPESYLLLHVVVVVVVVVESSVWGGSFGEGLYIYFVCGLAVGVGLTF